MRGLGIVLLSAALLAGCGERTGVADGAGDVPITQRAIAAVALEHAPTGTTSRVARYTDLEDPKGSLGADLRYRGDGESDGDLLRVFVLPGRGAKEPCQREEYDDGCETREVDGGRLTFTWTEEEPEEDPGYVAVVLQRDDERVSVSWYGDVITGDPREQDLFIPVDTLEAIAQDARISLTTSQEVVDAGEDLDDWDGGEPDPHAYDRVPSTDESAAWSYWLTRGGYADYSGLRPSPLKAEFGPGAVGGQFEQANGGAPAKPATIDVLASPQRPEWMAADVCATSRFAGSCVRVAADRGEKYLAWVPGEAGQGGEIWAIGDRGDEIVAVRFSGIDVRDRESAIEGSEWYLVKDLLSDRKLGLETDQEVLDAQF